MRHEQEKKRFAQHLKRFAASLPGLVTSDGMWTIRGFIDISGGIHPISSDTKAISKILELHLFPYFLSFAEEIGYDIELADRQNWYPDLTFIKRNDPGTKFAVDLKTTYRDEEHPGFCNGFTLGSHGEYFINRRSTKNIQYPYDDYDGHFCLGVIYTRGTAAKDEETKIYTAADVRQIPAVIRDLTFFAEEKWRIASDKGGSGNTANIGSIQKIDDILSGNGVFARAGEALFDDYWKNFGRLEVPSPRGGSKKLSSFSEYLLKKGLPENLNNPKAPMRKSARQPDKIYVPPLKIQGIKTKLVPLIRHNALLDEDTLWIEPFMGSGVVGFNAAPAAAVFADTNPHIINFYKQIKEGRITSPIVRQFLEQEGRLLSEKDADHYYEVRERFNKDHDPLDFLFLNRACFNGVIRFNKDFAFNVPYGHRPQRFSKAYITKIVNQVAHMEDLLRNNDWVFLCQPFQQTIEMANEDSFIYCDPPYIGRHVDYYDSWDEQSELSLREALTASGAPFMLSTWEHSRYRENEHLYSTWNFCHKITQKHYYYVGAKEDNRNSVTEALLTNYIPEKTDPGPFPKASQLSLFDFAAQT